MTDSRFRCCALITRYADARVLESVAVLQAHLARRGVVMLAQHDEPLPVVAEGVADGGALRVDAAELVERADLVIAIGGDGTLLYAAGLVAERGTPLLGINRGRLGFLTDVLPEDMIESVDAVFADQCEVDQRTLLAAELVGGDGRVQRGLALNDVVLQKNDSGRMLDFETRVNGRYVNTHGGDGLVISSATGSTAYALSCGGPIVEPQLDVLVVAPICPHTLSDRPVIVSGRSQIDVRLIDRADAGAAVSCDGRMLGELLPGDTLSVKPSRFKTTLLHPPGYDYFKLLRSKLNWGRRSFELPR